MQSIMKPERSFNFSYYMHTSPLKNAYQCVKLLFSYANEAFHIFQPSHVNKTFYVHMYTHVAAKMKEFTGFMVDFILVF